MSRPLVSDVHNASKTLKAEAPCHRLSSCGYALRTMSSIVSAAPVPHQNRAQPLAFSNLLFVVAALVFAMVVIGGITRLTESGLSITQWKPISGAIPPLSRA